MATFNSISTPAFTTTWNGSSFDNTESILVPADADYVVVFARLNGTSLPGTVEFNSAAMTTINASDTNSASAQIYYIAAPAAGTYDFTVDTTTTATSFQCIIGTVSGASGIGDTDTIGGYGGDRSLTLTTIADDLVMDILSSWQTMTVGAGQTTTLLNTNDTSGSQKTATTTTTAMSWTHAADWSSQAAIVFTDGGSSTSITQTDTTPEDGAQQTVTCANMTGPITAATLGGYDIISLLSGTDPASPITYTLDISALAEGTNASLPRLGVSLDLVFTTATDGAVTQSGIVIQSKTGWALVELEDTINKDANGLIATIEADTGLTVTNADALYYETANNASITVNGVYTSDLTTAGQSTKIILQDGGTSPATSYSDGFYPYGEAGGGGDTTTRDKRKKRMIRNFYWYGKEWKN